MGYRTLEAALDVAQVLRDENDEVVRAGEPWIGAETEQRDEVRLAVRADESLGVLLGVEGAAGLAVVPGDEEGGRLVLRPAPVVEGALHAGRRNRDKVEMADIDTLRALTNQLRNVDSVFDAYRVTPGT